MLGSIKEDLSPYLEVKHAERAVFVHSVGIFPARVMILLVKRAGGGA